MKIVEGRDRRATDVLIRRAIKINGSRLSNPRSIVGEVSGNIIQSRTAGRRKRTICKIGRDGHGAGIVDGAGIILIGSVDLHKGVQLRDDRRAIIIHELRARGGEHRERCSRHGKDGAKRQKKVRAWFHELN